MGGSTYLAFGDKTKDIALENIKDGVYIYFYN